MGSSDRRLVASARRLVSGRPPESPGTREQKRALDAFLRTDAVRLCQGISGVVSGNKERDVLTVIADRVNGEGFAYLKVATIAAACGHPERTVHRALVALERDSLVERIPTRQRTRRLQGASTYRLGAAVRAAVGLRESEWKPDTVENVATPEIAALAERVGEAPTGTGRAHETSTGRATTATTGRAAPDVAPGRAAPSALEERHEQGKREPDSRSTGRAERRPNDNHSPTSGYPPTSEVDLARARDTDLDETDRLIALVRRDHPGDLLAAELLAAIPGASEVDLDVEGWRTVIDGPHGTLDLRDLGNTDSVVPRPSAVGT
jgi:DNA-binding IclR family transcriptional regulator